MSVLSESMIKKFASKRFSSHEIFLSRAGFLCATKRNSTSAIIPGNVDKANAARKLETSCVAGGGGGEINTKLVERLVRNEFVRKIMLEGNYDVLQTRRSDDVSTKDLFDGAALAGGSKHR